MARRAILAVVVVLIVGAAVTVAASGDGAKASAAGSGRAHSAAKKALHLWRDFPVSEKPRPIVLNGGSGSVVLPSAGFTTGDAKLAFLAGDFKVETKFPLGPQKSHGYPIVSSRFALKRLRASAGNISRHEPPLKVTAVRLGTADFYTDRGLRRLPAWKFKVSGVNGLVSVLAVAKSRLFRAPATKRFSAAANDVMGDFAQANPPGTDITIHLTGAHAGTLPCDASYSASAQASHHAVAFTIRQKYAPGTGNCSAVGYFRRVSLHLRAPLGRRALVNSIDGSEVAVTRRG